jgi:hypothetical protein
MNFVAQISNLLRCRASSLQNFRILHCIIETASLPIGNRRPAPNAFGVRRLEICATSAVLLAVVVTGCVTKSAAKAQAQQAYVAGQRQALEHALQSKNSVTILGPVRNQQVPWTEGLTLIKALVAAEFYSKNNPTEILVVRQGRAIPVDVNQLLAGQDVPLQAGDLVNVR